MKVIAVLLGAVPSAADGLYLPVGDGVTGRAGQVAAIEILKDGDALPQNSEAYGVDERFQWDKGGDTVTRISFIRRAPQLTHEQFVDHWVNVHAPLARKHHPVVRYVQNIVVEKLTPGAPDVDGIAELGYRNMHDVHNRNYDSPAGAAIIRRDIQRFLDVPAGWRMLARRA